MIDATFWVAISFLLFVILLFYLKVPQKIDQLLNDNIKFDINDRRSKITKNSVLTSKVLDRSKFIELNISKVLIWLKSNGETIIIDPLKVFNKKLRFWFLLINSESSLPKW